MLRKCWRPGDEEPGEVGSREPEESAKDSEDSDDVRKRMAGGDDGSLRDERWLRNEGSEADDMVADGACDEADWEKRAGSRVD